MRPEDGIDGVLNFRAVAALPTRDGRRLRRGMIFRSGSFAGISALGVERLLALGVSRIIDLRNERERRAYGFGRVEQAGIEIVGLSHALELGELSAVLRDEAATPQDVVRTMEDVYRKLPFYFGGIYREFFRACLTHDGSIAVNCSAGKDRTGVAVALLLSVLGIPRDEIVDEYALTNGQVDRIRDNLRTRPHGRVHPRVSDEMLSALVRADPRYLAAMFEAVEKEAGSAEAFAVRAFGLDSGALAKLRNRYLDAG